MERRGAARRGGGGARRGVEGRGGARRGAVGRIGVRRNGWPRRHGGAAARPSTRLYASSPPAPPRASARAGAAAERRLGGPHEIPFWADPFLSNPPSCLVPMKPRSIGSPPPFFFLPRSRARSQTKTSQAEQSLPVSLFALDLSPWGAGRCAPAGSKPQQAEEGLLIAGKDLRIGIGDMPIPRWTTSPPKKRILHNTQPRRPYCLVPCPHTESGSFGSVVNYFQWGGGVIFSRPT